VLTGNTLCDTQSGLRGIPRELIPRLLLLDGERYDYEMNVLAYAAASSGIAEVPIQTIYLDQNRCSHFQPFWDSMRIYLVLARYCVSSLIAAVVDLLIFAFVFWITTSVLVSVMCGRVSSVANFVLNRRLVFRSGAGARAALVRYYGLVLLVAAASYFGIRMLSHGLGLNVLAAKVLVEIALSLASFSIQRSYVFPSWARQ
jgi:putative flippase GtrA